MVMASVAEPVLCFSVCDSKYLRYSWRWGRRLMQLGESVTVIVAVVVVRHREFPRGQKEKDTVTSSTTFHDKA